jgi:hypothetical protein
MQPLPVPSCVLAGICSRNRIRPMQLHPCKRLAPGGEDRPESCPLLGRHGIVLYTLQRVRKADYTSMSRISDRQQATARPSAATLPIAHTESLNYRTTSKSKQARTKRIKAYPNRAQPPPSTPTKLIPLQLDKSHARCRLIPPKSCRHLHHTTDVLIQALAAAKQVCTKYP